MKTERYCVVIALLAMMGATRTSAQSEYPKGKPIVTLFGDASAVFCEGKSAQWGYNLERAYLGYQYEINEHWKAKVVYDMGKGDDKTLQRVGYVKNAEVDYKNGRFAAQMGLTSTALFHVQEKFWGLRYVYKSFMDERKWGSSADLGVNASYVFTDWMTADVSVFNGEGYKKLQADNQLLYGVGMTFTPAQGWVMRAYTDFKTASDTVCQQHIALFAGYQCRAFRMGAEYNMERNHACGSGQDLNGLSVYGVGRLNHKMQLYVRYDYETASSGWTYSTDGKQTALLGLDCTANKLFSISPNLRLNKVGGEKMSIGIYLSGKVNL